MFELYNFVLNIINIKKCDSAMDEDLNPKMKVIPKPLGLN
jgi:hypothetical protein